MEPRSLPLSLSLSFFSQTVSIHRGPVTDAAVDKEQTLLVTCGWDGFVTFYDTVNDSVCASVCPCIVSFHMYP